MRRYDDSNRPTKFAFWGACTDMPDGAIIHYIIDPARSRRVTYQTFARNVDLDDLRDQNHPAMYRISAPTNWAITFYKSKLPNGQAIYYFFWSGIEHIFVNPEQAWPDAHRMVGLAQQKGY